MPKRYVHVTESEITSIAFSSIFQIGDASICRPRSNGIAIQREGNVWNTAHDLQFSDFSLFQLPAHWLEHELPVTTNTIHHNPHIVVGNVSIIGVGESSIVQFGGIESIDSESRLKHIRMLQDEDDDLN
ncbi:spore germination protein GerPE [Ornithinibacillus contaminans]|uniref:spore germination protein GerPE n=1 Tax=Ornithinibacillus contaminans TaxID=694055 RepID=UPI00064DB2AF|nr:spore germination protein GerPE [Ornithinibacillus contaminans]